MAVVELIGFFVSLMTGALVGLAFILAMWYHAKRAAFTVLAVATFWGLIAYALIATSANAATRVEIPGTLKFTDERSDCPRGSMLAYGPRGERGCWWVNQHWRRVTVRWNDGRVQSWSRYQFDAYARTIR